VCRRERGEEEREGGTEEGREREEGEIMTILFTV
jgi:hypothetical protein